MVVVHPDEVVGFDVRADDLAERAVDALVPALEIALELGQAEPVVEQRPQRAVRVAVIIFLDVLLRQVDRRGGDAAVGAETDVAGLARLARPAEPDAVMFAERRGERDGEPALRAALFRAGRLDAVGDDDEAAQRIALQGRLNSTAQLIIPTSE